MIEPPTLESVDVRAVLAANLPDLAVTSVVPLGEGLDNVAFEVDGSLVVRFRKDGDVAAEAAVLRAVAAVSPVAVPVPVFASGDRMAYRKLPGVPPAEVDVPPPGVLDTLIGFLRVIQALEVDVPVDVDDPAELLAEAAGRLGYVPAAYRADVTAFLAAPPPGRDHPVAFSHNDIGHEHVLVADGAVSGVIDWTDAAVVDPAYDHGLLFRDLGPAALAATPADLRERAVFHARCALLEDLAYGTEHGIDLYVRKSLASLRWVFSPLR
ncbi:phosphotransferase [Saccharothrix violaceirubra]|uniref:phosphotransferase n=1 Tax=Saccharothrix violaceirubra TaxID=413306 RepID=UPI001C87E0A3|nr:phosphotransferase [Saccharothrix violaceirubra]